MPQFAEGGTKPDESIGDPRFGPKESCWTCYKLKAKAEIEYFAGKAFCAQKCKEKFTTDNMVKCQRNPVCSEEPFLKKDGVPRLGRWFCSEDCCDKDIDIMKMLREREEAERIEEAEGEESDEAVEICL